jgi:spore germination cell wall hydrolase CwlJ-like protein
MADFLKDNDVTILARCIYGEARGEISNVKAAVGYAVKNRVTQKNRSYHEVILHDKAFSCFNENDKNYPAVSDPEAYDKKTKKKAWKKCLDIAKKVIDGKIKNPIGKATHYHSEKTEFPAGKRYEYLKDKKVKFVKKVGKLWFFSGVKYTVKKMAIKCGAKCKNYEEYGLCDNKTYNPPCHLHA